MPDAVISDTSPLQYLHQRDQLHLLPHFYQQVIIPPAVEQELAVGRSLGVSLPNPTAVSWLHIRAPVDAGMMMVASALGRGEREAIALARESSSALLIMDDGQSRRIGRMLGLTMTGTVGIPARATREGLIPSLVPMRDRLEHLGFRLGADAKAAALAHVRE